MNLINRVKDMLLKPRDTWFVIEAEAATPASLYTQYLMILAVIPAVCSFIGMSIIGIGGFGFSIRIPILYGLVNMVVQYIMSLIGVYVFAWIINLLAPSFGGQKNPLNALKLAVYATTASMVGGVFGLLPSLWLLGVLASLYSIYLIYLGLPVLMKNPQEKSVVYTAVVLLVGIFFGMLMALVTRIITPSPYTIGKAGGDAMVNLKTPGGEIKIDTAKIDAATKKLEEAQKQMEVAQKSGDTAAMAKATGDAMAAATGMIGGDANLLPIPPDTLKPYLLPQLGAFKRVSFEVTSGAAAGLSGTTGRAEYEAGNQRIQLTITDAGGMSAFVRMTGAMVVGEKETGTGGEKTWQEAGRTLHHKFRKDGSHAEFRMILKNGVMVELSGSQVAIEMLRAQASMLDLNSLENIQRPKKS